MMSVYGKRCLRPGCTGRVTFEVWLTGVDAACVLHGVISVLGHAAVQSAQVLRLSLRWGGCVEMFARSGAGRLVTLPQRDTV